MSKQERKQAAEPTTGSTWAGPTSASSGVLVRSRDLDDGPCVRAVIWDYLRVTLPDDWRSDRTWAGLRRFLGELSPRQGGWHGWYNKTADVAGGGIVAYCDDPMAAKRQGVLVDLPAAAVAAVGDRLEPFIGWAIANGGHVCRIDFAIDDDQGLITLERLEAAEDEGTMVSRVVKTSTVTSRTNGKPSGWTYYIGSRSSEAFFRLYNKEAEQRAKGRRPAEGWRRLELEAKGGLAHALAREVLRRGSRAVVQEIKRRLRFVRPSATDTNKWRWEEADWWRDLLGAIKAGPPIVSGARQPTIAEMTDWLKNTAAPTLVAILQAAGGDLDAILEVIDAGRYRLRRKHRDAISAALAMAAA